MEENNNNNNNDNDNNKVLAPLKVQPVSDLHLEFESMKKKAPKFSLPLTDSDVIILAGDIGNKFRGIQFAYKTATKHKKPVIYVLGNHEYYGSVWERYVSKVKVQEEELKKSYPDATVHFLDDDEVVIGNVRFLGTTLWTNFGINNDNNDSKNIAFTFRTVGEKMNDYKKIKSIQNGDTKTRKFVPGLVSARHKTHYAWLKSKLATPYDAYGAYGVLVQKTVIISHHAPLLQCLDPRYKDTLLNAAYASDLSDLLESDNFDLWIYGHVHYGADFMEKNVRFICNPRGYPGEPSGGKKFDPSLVVEV